MPADPALMNECLPLVKNVFQSCDECTLNLQQGRLGIYGSGYVAPSSLGALKGPLQNTAVEAEAGLLF